MLRAEVGNPLVALPLAVFIGAVVVAVLAAAAGAGIAAVSPSMDLILLTCIGAVLLVPILRRCASGTFDVFEPLTVFTVAFGVMFLARPVAMLVTDSLVVESTEGPAYDLRPTFSLMLAVALIGAIGFQLGYAAGLGSWLGKRVKAPPRVWHVDTAVTVALALTGAGVGLFGLFVFRSGGWDALRDLLAGRDPSQADLFRSSTAYFYSGILLLIPATLILVATGTYTRRPSLSLLGACVAVLVLIRAGPTGARMMLLFLVGSLVVYYYLRTGKRPSVASGIVILVAVFFGISFLRDVRTQSVREEQGVASILTTSLSDPGDAVRRLLAGGDTEMAAMLALEMQVVPTEHPYQLGRATVGDLLIRPIPRVLWPEKPLSPREKLIDSLWPTRYRAGAANPEFSSMAWFYLDGGLPGVFLGMFILGVLFKSSFAFFQSHRSNAAAQVIYASLVPFMVVTLRDSPTDTIARMAFVTLPLVLILVLASQSQRTTRQPFARPRPEGESP
jgi:hypothetical protein